MGETVSPASTNDDFRNHDTQVQTSKHFKEELQKLIQARTTDLTVDEKDAVEALPSGAALLVVRRGPDAGARFLLDQNITVAGRHPEVDIFLDDVTVSRRHAELRHGAEGWSIRDVGSLNGTYVNRKRVEDRQLSGGDEVQIGKFRFIFLVGVDQA